MILIIRWHLYKGISHKIDYGARMCEFLFISSGFLVGYNYYKRAMPSTYYASCKYTYKHLRAFYPLHTINSFYWICTYKSKFNLTDYEIIIYNFLLVKVWSRYQQFASGFNGISWFVSALLFCYFLCPFLLGGIQNINNSLIIFSLVAFIRVGIEQLIKNGSKNILDFNFHYNPIIRLMDFYLGMLMIPLFLKIKYYLDKIHNKSNIKFIFTSIQIIFPVFIYFIMLEFNNKLIRCYFVLIFCFCIFLISYDYGYLSYIIKKKLCKEIMSCQMEMYLLQRSLNTILVKILNSHMPQNEELKFSIKVAFIFIISYIYKKKLKEKLAVFMDKIFDLFKIIFK
jgi:peptidoglycan/LPS O-acetylase OafA/YrhL